MNDILVLNNDLILCRIKHFILADLLHNNMLATKKCLQALSSISPKYASIFCPDKIIVNYLQKLLTTIGFFVYVEQSLPSDTENKNHKIIFTPQQKLNNLVGSPVRYNLHTLNHVQDWHVCQHCLTKLAIFFYHSNLEIGIVDYIPSKNWEFLFCDFHWKHISDTYSCSWKEVFLKVLPEYNNPTNLQINLIIYLHQGNWRWC